jgi:hypothetical protein
VHHEPFRDLVLHLLHQFLDEHLCVGLHRSDLLLPSGVVAMRVLVGRKIIVSDTKCLRWDRGIWQRKVERQTSR